MFVVRPCKLPAVLLVVLLTIFSSADSQAQPEKDPWSAQALDSVFRIYESYKHRPASVSSPHGPFISPSANNEYKTLSATKTSEICYTVSGRNFLYQDSLLLWTADPIITSDGNVLVSGMFGDYSKQPAPTGGFCMKTDIDGNVIWKKLYDSVNSVRPDYINYFRLRELKNGNFLMAGRTENNVSGNDDLLLTRINATGNIIWSKTYESRYWQGYNGSGDFFNMKAMEEDTATGDIYVAGSLWGGMGVVMKINGSNGTITWSNGYDRSQGGSPFGLFVNQNNLVIFQLGNGYYNQSYIYTTGLSKTNGDTLFVKALEQTGDLYAPRLFNTIEAVRTVDGHYLLSGRTTGHFEYPVHTGTKDLHHAGVIELDASYNFVKAYGFKNRIRNNGYNTRISLSPDYTGVFTMLDFKSGYNAEVQLVMFNKQNIYHQRKRYHQNEGIPYEPPSLKLPSGKGFLNIKLMGDSTKLASDGARIDYYRFHGSDTASMCIGLKDSATTTWNFNFQPASYYLQPLQLNVFRESLPKTINLFNFETVTGPACQVISHCDTLILKADRTTVCPLGSVVITTSKNKACGSLVPLSYDTTWVKTVTRLTDTTYAVTFRSPGSGYIYGSLMGCVLHKDSVLINVIPTLFQLDLGPDQALCTGNSLTLNAKSGFSSYTWQNNSTDSVFTVTQPGIYFLMATNACGTVFTDTVQVTQAPPIDFFVSPDRTKCNTDTLHLNAPAGFLNYQWSNNYEISSLTGQSVIVRPLTDTVYYVKAEKTPGCFAFDTIRIKVFHSPVIDLGADRSFCQGDSVVLDAGAGFSSYLWNNGSTARTFVAGNAGEYSIKATTTDGCISKDTFRVLTVHTLPIVNLDKNNAICRGDLKMLDAGNFNSYAWNTAEVGRTISVNAIGVYWVQVTDANGCKGSDTTSITILHEKPSMFLPADTAICSYGTLMLQGSPGYQKYKWSTGSASASVTIDKPGNYSLTVTDVNGCESTESIIVSPKQCLTGFYMPNGFTPDADGLNDGLRPLIFGDISEYRFTIYNRWGEVVFETRDPQKRWTGFVRGLDNRTTVFAWTCSFQLKGEEPEFRKGLVTLIK